MVAVGVMMLRGRHDRPHRLGLGVGPDAGVDQTLVEAFRLAERIQRDRKLLDARRSEVVAGAAHRHHQRVVLERPRLRDLVALVVVCGRQTDLALGSIQPDHLAITVAEMMPVGLRQIVERVVIDVHAPGGHFVQQRLPQMSARTLDQRDVGSFALAQLVTQPGRQFQAGGTPADNHDVVQCDEQDVLIGVEPDLVIPDDAAVRRVPIVLTLSFAARTALAEPTLIVSAAVPVVSESSGAIRLARVPPFGTFRSDVPGCA